MHSSAEAVQGGDKLIYAMRYLDVAGKHVRLLPIGFTRPDRMWVDFYPGFDWANAPRWPSDGIRPPWMRWDGFQESVVLLTANLGSDIRPKFHIPASVAFRDLEGFEREPIVTVLNEFVDLVEGIVRIFEPGF